MKKRFVFRGIVLLLILTGIWSLYSSRYRLEVTHYQISSARLPEAFNGYRIVQLSDLHAARFGKEDEDLIEQVAQLEPDMIAMTGDYIEKKEHIPQVQHLVETLSQIAPVYFSSGNHDWASGHAHELRRVIEQAGGVWLSNDYRIITRNGEELIVAGVEDPNSYAEMTRPDELMDAIDAAYPDHFSILLGHRNDWPMRYPELKTDVILCGHGHGGIIRLPGVGGLLGTDFRFFPKYDAGLFPCGRYVMVVSRGLGNGIPIPRFGNRPEILCLTLECA